MWLIFSLFWPSLFLFLLFSWFWLSAMFSKVTIPNFSGVWKKKSLNVQLKVSLCLHSLVCSSNITTQLCPDPIASRLHYLSQFHSHMLICLLVFFIATENIPQILISCNLQPCLPLPMFLNYKYFLKHNPYAISSISTYSHCNSFNLALLPYWILLRSHQGSTDYLFSVFFLLNHSDHGFCFTFFETLFSLGFWDFLKIPPIPK